ncbi:hypothetical protein OAK45_00090 [Verrucomicrobia bacterium]|nr:hypothetical protein [Verrucomicrobiota bacterium]MDC0219030.1 hypothetical protein [Verrucomicrobiota bacterium]
MAIQNKYKNIARICGGAIAMAFFLPWIDIMLFSFSGMELSDMFNKLQGLQSGLQSFANAFTEGTGEGALEVEGISKPVWLYGTMLFPVLGVASAVINKKLLHIFSATFILGIVIWAFSDLRSTLGGELGDDQFSILQIMSIGLWVTIFAPFGQLFGALVYKDNAGESGSVQPYEIGKSN